MSFPACLRINISSCFTTKTFLNTKQFSPSLFCKMSPVRIFLCVSSIYTQPTLSYLRQKISISSVNIATWTRILSNSLGRLNLLSNLSLQKIALSFNCNQPLFNLKPIVNNFWTPIKANPFKCTFQTHYSLLSRHWTLLWTPQTAPLPLSKLTSCN